MNKPHYQAQFVANALENAVQIGYQMPKKPLNEHLELRTHAVLAAMNLAKCEDSEFFWNECACDSYVVIQRIVDHLTKNNRAPTTAEIEAFAAQEAPPNPCDEPSTHVPHYDTRPNPFL